MSEQQSAQVEEREMVSVDAKALKSVLWALVGPGHHIRELQATMDLDRKGLSIKPNPINVLIDQYNAHASRKIDTSEANSNGN